MIEHGTIASWRTGESRGVRRDCARACFRSTNLADYDRFTRVQSLFSDTLELLRRLHVFKQQEKNVGDTFVEHVIDEVEGFERSFVAGGDDMPESQIAGASTIENRET